MSGLTPQLQALPSGQDSKLFNITSFGGINYAENPFAASSSTASEMKNLYVNDEGTLSTRPRLQFEKTIPLDKIITDSELLSKAEIVQAIPLEKTIYEYVGTKKAEYILNIRMVDKTMICFIGDDWWVLRMSNDANASTILEGIATVYTGIDEENKVAAYVTSEAGLFSIQYTEDGANLYLKEIKSDPKLRRIYESTDNALQYTQVNDENLLSTGYIDQAYFDPYTNYIDARFKDEGIEWDIGDFIDFKYENSIQMSHKAYLLGVKGSYSIWFDETPDGFEHTITFLNAVDNTSTSVIQYSKYIPITSNNKPGRLSYISLTVANQISIHLEHMLNTVINISTVIDDVEYTVLGADYIDLIDYLYISAIVSYDKSSTKKGYCFLLFKINPSNQSYELVKLININNPYKLSDIENDPQVRINYNMLYLDEFSNVYFLNLWDGQVYSIINVDGVDVLNKMIDIEPQYESDDDLRIISHEVVISYKNITINNGKLYIIDDGITVYDLTSTSEKTYHKYNYDIAFLNSYKNNSIVTLSVGEVFTISFLGRSELKPNVTTFAKTTSLNKNEFNEIYDIGAVKYEDGKSKIYISHKNSNGVYVIDTYSIEYKTINSVEPNLSTTVLYEDEDLYKHKHPYVTKFDNKLWFYGGEGNIIRYTSDLSSTFLPKNNYDDIGDGTPITSMLQIANDYLGVFKSDTAYLISESSDEEDLYYVTNLKTELGNIPKNQAIVTGLSNQSVVINDYGIYALGQSNNSVDTDTIFTSISEAINPKFVLMKDKEKIKTHNHRFLTYFYLDKTDSTDIWVYDNRNSAWYFWEFPISISTMVEVKESTDNVDEKLTKVFTNDGKVYDFTTALYEVEADDSIGESGIRTYRDFIGLDDYDKPLFKRIDWYWKSQPLTLNTINYLKKLNEATFIFADRDRFQMNSAQNIVIATSQQQDNLQLFYKFRSYRKKSRLFDSAYTNDIDYLYNAKVKPRIQKFDFVDLELSNKIVDDNGNIKYTYTGENDGSTPTDDWKDILDKLNLIGITFKYSLS